ncbi:MAG TPA: hypothetical protein VFA04_18320 [Bryobacteraceae bacterium]|nr:hypothetical protein [Bryobacteraceae bacterium]
MIRTIATTVFNAAVVVIATSVAVWLTVSGYTLQPGGLLLGMGAIFGAVIFGFRLAEGFGPDRLSIWAGPGWSLRSAPAPGANGELPGRTA